MSKPLIIDAHMHIFHSKELGNKIKQGYEIWEYGHKPDVSFSRYGGDTADALSAIERAGASKAVVVNLFVASRVRNEALSNLPEGLDKTQKAKALSKIESELSAGLIASNNWICDVARTSPFLEPFICADPWLLSSHDMKSHIEDMVASRGAKGVKLHPTIQQFYMHDEKMMAILKTCVDLDLPVVSHTGPSMRGDQYAEPDAFYKVLKNLPELRLVMAHLGGGAWRQIPKLAKSFPNVGFDCSEIIEWMGSEKGPSGRELAKLILEIGPERVMMGSDFPWYDIDHNVELVMSLPLLSQEEKEAILGKNAAGILKI